MDAYYVAGVAANHFSLRDALYLAASEAALKGEPQKVYGIRGEAHIHLATVIKGEQK